MPMSRATRPSSQVAARGPLWECAPRRSSTKGGSIRRWAAVPLALAWLLVLGSAAGAVAPRDRLDAYTAAVSPAALQVLRAQGVEATASRAGGRLRLGLVLTPGQRAELARRGVPTRLARVPGGRTLRQVAAAEAAGGYTVWRSWDERGGIRDQLRRIARRNPGIAKLETIGTSGQGRPILALKLTRGARRRADGSRPSVLF